MTTSQPRLDLTKPVETRDGRKVRILCTDRKGTTSPIIGLITDSGGKENFCSWDLNGKYTDYSTSRADLINTKKKLYLLVWLPKGVSQPRSGVYTKKDGFEINKEACVAQGWPVLHEDIIEVD